MQNIIYIKSLYYFHDIRYKVPISRHLSADSHKRDLSHTKAFIVNLLIVTIVIIIPSKANKLSTIQPKEYDHEND